MEALILCFFPAVGLAIFVVWLRGRGQVNRLKADIALINTSAGHYARQQWIETLPALTYRNEIEVEIKFIAPLVTFLGFTPEQIDIRVPIAVQVGRQTSNGQADWVLWAPGRRAPIAIIEAKAPGAPLNGAAQGQARSYAFALNAPLILLTNGRQLELYRRGVQEDQRILSATPGTLARDWPTLATALQEQS